MQVPMVPSGLCPRRIEKWGRAAMSLNSFFPQSGTILLQLPLRSKMTFWAISHEMARD